MGLAFECDRKVLHHALQDASRAVASGNAVYGSAIAGVHLSLQGDELTVTGTDNELTLSNTSTVVGTEDGVAVVPARLLGDIVRILPDGLVLFAGEEDGSNAQISASGSEFSLRTFSPDEYPIILGLSSDNDEAYSLSGKLDGVAIGEAFSQVTRAASSDDSRPILTGVLMKTDDENQLHLVATDSYRLALKVIPDASPFGEVTQVIIPARALNELQRNLTNEDVEFGMSDIEARFRIGSLTLITRLIAGDFPNYEGLIPKDMNHEWRTDRGEFLNAVKRVKLMALDSAPLRLTLTEGSNTVELSARTPDVGNAHETVSGAYSGDGLTIAFNPGYLVEGLEAIKGDEVLIRWNTESTPALIEDADDEQSYLYLLMPVRVT